MDRGKLSTVFTLEHCDQNQVISIPMEVNGYGKRSLNGTRIPPQTVLEIISPGLEPIVDCVRTEEGLAFGPIMRLLGSVASQEALEENSGNIILGQVVSGYRLVMANPNDPSNTYLIPGRVEASLENPVTVRTKRRRGRPASP
jgi:hypothetical protein